MHVTCVICLFQLEIGIVEFSRISLFLFGILFFLGEVIWSVRARQCVDVRWESSIVSNTLLSLNMVCLAMVSLHILTLFHYIQARTRSWKRTDRRLEISFTGPCLSHFASGLLLIVEIKIVFFLPKTSAGFICFAEILVGSKMFRWIFCFFWTEHVWLSSNLLWRPGESCFSHLDWAAASWVTLLWIHDIAHRLSGVVVLW